MKYGRTGMRAAGVLAAVLFFAGTGAGSAAAAGKPDRLRGFSRLLAPADCRVIIDDLKKDTTTGYADAVEKYYGEDANDPARYLYNPALPKWVVYVGTDAAHEKMLYNSEDSSDLTGGRFVWVLVFTDTDVPSSQPKNLALSMLRIDASAGPAEKMLRAVGKMFSLKDSSSVPDSVAKNDAGTFQDINSTITLRAVVSPRKQDGTCSLAAGSARLDLDENSIARLVIGPAPGGNDTSLLKDSDVRSVIREVSAGDRSYLGASIAAGMPFSHASSKKISISPDLYLLANIYGLFYDSRPRIGRIAPSWTIGTNLGPRGGFLDEIVLGVTLGNLVGSGGVVVGDSFSGLSTKVKQHFFLGLNLSL